MRQVLIFGAGKSATFLIGYMIKHAATENWMVTVVDSNLGAAQAKIGASQSGQAVSFDIHDAAQRGKFIAAADIVISLLPPSLHWLVAQDCLAQKKNLLTASYVDDAIRQLRGPIQDAGLLFLCEMGLDPGIDHMSAMQMIDSIGTQGGRVTSFESHCGGLVAPESDDNPWHYKISWNPRSVVLAGKAGAHFIKDGEEKRIAYEELFTADNKVDVPGLGQLAWYPNRDSLSYATTYGLPDATTFLRTTLRHPDFMTGWKHVIELQLTDETPAYDTNGKTLAAVFKEHLAKNGFGSWLEQKIAERFTESKDMLSSLVRLMKAEREAEQSNIEVPGEFLSVDEKGNLHEVERDAIKNRAAALVATKMRETDVLVKQLMFLGLDDKETIVNRGVCSAADILQFAVEKKFALAPADRDMIVMMHEIRYVLAGKQHTKKSVLIAKGDDNIHTAMAKTVGLPLAIAARLIMNGKIALTGLHIPTSKEIYEPVLGELSSLGIHFNETDSASGSAAQ